MSLTTGNAILEAWPSNQGDDVGVAWHVGKTATKLYLGKVTKLYSKYVEVTYFDGSVCCHTLETSFESFQRVEDTARELLALSRT